MITRREMLIALGADALAAPLATFAQQQPGKVYRLCYLSPRPGIESRDEAFRQGLHELGYVEGKNVVIEWRFSKGNLALFPEYAAELVRLKPDCIVVAGIDATRAAKQATDAIPIVMANASDDPVRLGLIASLARPGGNITGLIDISEELAGKRMQLLKETAPNASRVAILWDENSKASGGHIRATEDAARGLGLRLQNLAVRNPESLDDAFRAAAKERAQTLIVVATGLINSHRSRIADLAAKSRLPSMYSNSSYVSAGGLMSYGPDIDEQYRRAATFVDKILKGAKPADLPIERPTKFEFIINLKAAKQIGLKIPQNVLARATKVIE